MAKIIQFPNRNIVDGSEEGGYIVPPIIAKYLIETANNIKTKSKISEGKIKLSLVMIDE